MNDVSSIVIPEHYSRLQFADTVAGSLNAACDIFAFPACQHGACVHGHVPCMYVDPVLSPCYCAARRPQCQDV